MIWSNSRPDIVQRAGGAVKSSGGSESPGPSARCMIGVSTQRPNLKPTERSVPTGSKPWRRWRAIEAAIAAVADDRHDPPPRAGFAAGDQFGQQRAADAAPAKARRDIDAVFERMPIGGARVVGAA